MTDISEEVLGRVVERFYARVRADELIGPVFNGAISDWPKHLAKLHAFWSSVMLTSGRYKGQPMAAHFVHAEAMTPERFERWLDLWTQTTNEMLGPGQAAATQEKARSIAESLKLGIAFQRDAGASPAERLANLRRTGRTA